MRQGEPKLTPSIVKFYAMNRLINLVSWVEKDCKACEDGKDARSQAVFEVILGIHDQSQHEMFNNPTVLNIAQAYDYISKTKPIDPDMKQQVADLVSS